MIRRWWTGVAPLSVSHPHTQTQTHGYTRSSKKRRSPSQDANNPPFAPDDDDDTHTLTKHNAHEHILTSFLCFNNVWRQKREEKREKEPLFTKHLVVVVIFVCVSVCVSFSDCVSLCVWVLCLIAVASLLSCSLLLLPPPNLFFLASDPHSHTRRRPLVVAVLHQSPASAHPAPSSPSSDARHQEPVRPHYHERRHPTPLTLIPSSIGYQRSSDREVARP